MKKFLLLLLLLPSSVFAVEAEIVRVIDGDTVIVDINGIEERLRIVGIDTPETVKTGSPVECFGIEASNQAKTILAEGSIVTLELQDERDRFDRLLGYIEIDGEDFGAMMISGGYAYTFRAFDHDRLNNYIRLEKEARDNEIGLWSPTACNGNPNTKNDEIIRQKKITFWQNIFRTIGELLKFFR